MRPNPFSTRGLFDGFCYDRSNDHLPAAAQHSQLRRLPDTEKSDLVAQVGCASHWSTTDRRNDVAELEPGLVGGRSWFHSSDHGT